MLFLASNDWRDMFWPVSVRFGRGRCFGRVTSCPRGRTASESRCSTGTTVVAAVGCARIVPTQARNIIKHEGTASRRSPWNSNCFTIIDKHHQTRRRAKLELKVRCSTT